MPTITVLLIISGIDLRSVVTYRGQGQSVSSGDLHRFALPSSLWFCDYSQHSRFLTACRRLEKVLSSIFDTSISSLMMWNLQQRSVEWKKMWYFTQVNTYSDPSCIFSSGSRPPTPRIYVPSCWLYDVRTNLQWSDDDDDDDDVRTRDCFAATTRDCDGSDLVLCTVDGGLRAIVFLYVFL